MKHGPTTSLNKKTLSVPTSCIINSTVSYKMKYLWKSINLNSVFLSIHHSKNHYSMKWRSFTFTLSIWEANGITCWCHLNYKSNGKWYDWVMVWIFKENWWIIWAFISIKRHWTSKRCLFIIFQKIKIMCLRDSLILKSGLNSITSTILLVALKNLHTNHCNELLLLWCLFHHMMV